MDSFVLAEMFKYLYLLFAEDEDLILPMDDFVFTTEAHLLPLSLGRKERRVRVYILDCTPHYVSFVCHMNDVLMYCVCVIPNWGTRLLQTTPLYRRLLYK